jgi:hypothetical protein
MFIPLVAVSLSFIYFLHQDHLQIARFCKELVTDFSKRYDQMNEKLQRALQKTGDFNEKETLDFVDYFNLCAEEYLFYKLGYIHRSIWWSWEKGMEQYGADARVVAIWMREKVTDSYYGFKFPVQIVP